MANKIWGDQSDQIEEGRRRYEEQQAVNAYRMDRSMDSIDQTNQNPLGQMVIDGTPDQMEHQAANLSQAGAMTGQSIFSTGQQSQDYYNSLKARREGGDAVSKYMMAGRNRNLANVGRTFSGKGVAGGVAASAMESAQNSADKDINAQMQKKQRTDDQDLFNWVKRNQKIQGEALSMGKDQGLADGIDTSTGSGIFGSVICTELHRQGILDRETYLKDAQYGWSLSIHDPYAYIGYYSWAKHVVPLMQKSKVFTKIVSVFAKPWAENISGKPNRWGAAILTIGLPVCRYIGTVVVHFPRVEGLNERT